MNKARHQYCVHMSCNTSSLSHPRAADEARHWLKVSSAVGDFVIIYIIYTYLGLFTYSCLQLWFISISEGQSHSTTACWIYIHVYMYIYITL